jgi:hypothetical protein
MAGCSAKLKNRKLENVLIVINYLAHARVMYINTHQIITSQRYDNRRLTLEVQKRSKKLGPF